MSRSDRLFKITQLLRSGTHHRAQDLAAQLGVSDRTLYRDMDTLRSSGFPVSGTPGTGYHLTEDIQIPPLNLSNTELEALNLGLAVVAQAADPTLKQAALSLAEKLDAAAPQTPPPSSDPGFFAPSPFSDSTRTLSHMPLVRGAIAARQKLRITYSDPTGAVTTRTLRPLKLEYWGRVWVLAAWCERRLDFRSFRLDHIDTAEALPELFQDEPGKTLSARAPSRIGAHPPPHPFENTEKP